MPRRTIRVLLVQCHPRYKPNHLVDLTKLSDGVDLLHLFHGFLSSAAKFDQVDIERQRYTAIEPNWFPAGRSLMFSTAVGRFGEKGENRNIRSRQAVHKFGPDEAPTVNTRALLCVPPASTSALFFIERSSGMGGGSDIIRLFAKAWQHRYRDWTLKTQSLTESEAWLAAAELESVTAIRYGWNSDIAETGLPKVLGDVHYTLTPPKGQKYLPHKLWEMLRDKRVERSSLLGFTGSNELDEIIVRLERNGREKSFVLERESTPPLLYELCAANDPVPIDTEFKDYCLTVAADHFEQLGTSWQAGWDAGNWSPFELTVHMEVPDGQQDLDSTAHKQTR